MRLSTSIICSIVRLPSAANLQSQQHTHVLGPDTFLHHCREAGSTLRGACLHTNSLRTSSLSPAPLILYVWTCDAISDYALGERHATGTSPHI